MTLRAYTDSLPTVKRPPGTRGIIARSLIEDVAALADERHLRRREEVMEEALRVLYRLLAAEYLEQRDEEPVRARSMVRRARDLARAALVLANTCWHCGWVGTQDDPVVDRSEQIMHHNPDGPGEMPTGYWRADQGCKHGARCLGRQKARP